MRLNSILEAYENYEIYLTNQKQGNAFWSEASRRTTKKFRLNIDAGSVCNFYFIVKKNCDHCRNVRDTDRTLCRVRYSSTSCIALINCQRDVNEKSINENCELLVINITIFWFLYNAGHLTSMHVFVTIKTVLGVTKSCNILTKITQNAWERLSSWTEARTFPHIMNNQCTFTMEYKNKNKDQCSVTIRFVYT